VNRRGTPKFPEGRGLRFDTRCDELRQQCDPLQQLRPKYKTLRIAPAEIAPRASVG
jgi:hypothetical protein